MTKALASYMFTRALRRVGRALFPRRFPKIVTLGAPEGVPLRFRVHGPREQQALARSGWEEETWVRFLSLLRPSDVVFDVGANVGLYALAAGRLLSSGNVYAFEPDPEIRSHLAQNVALNDLTNVEIIDWAAGDREGVVEFYTDGSEGFSPSFIRERVAGAPTRKITVATTTLDAAIERREVSLPSVLKIDVEGAEHVCLCGAGRLLHGEYGPPPRLVCLEVHPQSLRRMGSSPKGVVRLMADAGYEETWRRHRANEIHCFFSVAEQPSRKPGSTDDSDRFL